MLILIVKVMTFGLITGKRFLLVGNYQQKLKMVMLKKGKSEITDTHPNNKIFVGLGVIL